MSNTELISKFISLNCDHCDQRKIVREEGGLIYSCSAEAAEDYLSTGSCSSAVVNEKKGVMTPFGFTQNKDQL